jgi:hypothetical protein
MQNFTVYTLVDITETGQYGHSSGSELEKKQQQNFLTLIQTIGLRVNPNYTAKPTTIDKFDVGTYPFGSTFTGTHRVWQWNFNIEFDGVFTDADNNEVGVLIKDLHLVPIIVDLSESAKMEIPVFDTVNDATRNTLIFMEFQ